MNNLYPFQYIIDPIQWIFVVDYVCILRFLAVVLIKITTISLRYYTSFIFFSLRGLLSRSIERSSRSVSPTCLSLEWNSQSMNTSPMMTVSPSNVPPSANDYYNNPTSEERVSILQKVRHKWRKFGRMHQERMKVAPAKAGLQRKAFQRKAREKAALQLQQRKTGITIKTSTKSEAQNEYFSSSTMPDLQPRVVVPSIGTKESPLAQIQNNLTRKPAQFDHHKNRRSPFGNQNYHGQISTNVFGVVEREENLFNAPETTTAYDSSCDMSVSSHETDITSTSSLFNRFQCHREKQVFCVPYPS